MDMSTKLKQDATLWASTPDGFGGFTFAAPQALKCRWEEKQELVPNSTIMSAAVAYVSIDVAVDDYLLGATSVSADPYLVNALRIVAFKKVPDLRNLDVVRKVWLR